MRRQLFWVLIVGAAANLGAPGRDCRAQAVVADQGTLAARRLLASLPPAIEDARKAAVETTFAAFPGAAETFLFALLHRDFLAAARAAPESLWAPVDPAAGLNVLPGRVAGIHGGGGEILAERGGSVYQSYDRLLVSPLLLDLDGDGLPGVDSGDWRPHLGLAVPEEALEAFDVNGDGFEELTEWLGGGDGLLVDPEDPSQVVIGAAGPGWIGAASGRDLVGTSEGYASGFEKLSRRDADLDGAVSGSELDGLFVWTDPDDDARIDPGELSTLAGLGITSLRLPGAGEAVGSFLREGSAAPLWDWWPSYSLARKLPPPGPIPAGRDPLPLTVRELPGLLAPPAGEVPIDPDGWIQRAALAGLGLDWPVLNLLALAPDGSRLLLLQRSAAPGEIAAGRANIMWSMIAQDNYATVGRLPLALPSVHAAVFIASDSLLVVGANGARLLRVDLGTGAQAVLEAAGGRGFRAGEYAWRAGGEVYLTGYFHDAEGAAGPDCVARFRSSEDGYVLEPVADLEALRSPARAAGTILIEHLVLPDLAYYIVEEAGGATRLVASRGFLRDPLVFQGIAYLSGLAASGSRVLYFREAPDLARGVEAVVGDVETGASFSLGTGDFTYPYLVAGGEQAVVTEIDWAAGSSSFRGLVYTEGSFRPGRSLATEGIGVLRLADDGSARAYLGPEGVNYVRDARPRALRGDCNGDGEVAGVVTDAITLLTFNFLGGRRPPCLAACDANGDGDVVGLVTDAVYVLTFNFLGGTPPAAPFPGCGDLALETDPDLGCAEPPDDCL